MAFPVLLSLCHFPPPDKMSRGLAEANVQSPRSAYEICHLCVCVKSFPKYKQYLVLGISAHGLCFCIAYNQLKSRTSLVHFYLQPSILRGWKENLLVNSDSDAHGCQRLSCAWISQKPFWSWNSLLEQRTCQYILSLNYHMLGFQVHSMSL